ncbi:MAG TPA: DUF72 domain-containing protein [Dehalococcoidia bacterium]|nr:DUF72 domain-containing protein [Dehalococcoidia bacterium]
MAILIGTASWAEATLIKSGRFYPAEARTPEQRLRFYASQFPVVEVDSTFYALPSFTNSQLWASRTPDGFTFDVKLFRAFTLHQTPLKSLPKDVRDQAEGLANKAGNVYYAELPEALKDELWQLFLDGIAPLKSAGKLGYLLLQLPPWGTKNRDHVAHVEECLNRMDGYQVALEFRNATWLSERSRASTLAMLREWNVPVVIVDEPQGFASSMPLVWEATSPEMAVVRFHGRNKETWTKKGLPTSALRFNYLYSDDELREFVAPMQQIAQATRQVHALFNNCYEDKAVQNARRFMEMLGAG